MNVRLRIDKIRKFIIIFYLVLGVGLLVSIGFELFYNGSFISWISELSWVSKLSWISEISWVSKLLSWISELSWVSKLSWDSILSWISRLSCPKFMQAPVVLEIIKIIGFSNAFLGWFYAKLDNKMIGLSYSEILKAVFPYHHFFTIVHLLCNILCLAFSTANLSESSLLSLAMVLNGFVYQWITLYHIVLNSDHCESLAEQIWKTDDKKRNSSAVFKSLSSLSSDFCDENLKHYDKHLECFCSLLIEYIVNDTEINKLKSISEIWSTVSNVQNPNRILNDALDYIFNDTKEIKDVQQRKHVTCELVSAYMIFKMYFDSQNAKENNIQKNFSELVEEMWTLKHNISIKISAINQEAYDFFSDCIQTNLYILAWMFFQFRSLQLTKDMISYIPPKINDNYIEKVKDILFLPIVKEQESVDLAFKVAKSQLEKEIQK